MLDLIAISCLVLLLLAYVRPVKFARAPAPAPPPPPRTGDLWAGESSSLVFYVTNAGLTLDEVERGVMRVHIQPRHSAVYDPNAYSITLSPGDWPTFRSNARARFVAHTARAASDSVPHGPALPLSASLDIPTVERRAARLTESALARPRRDIDTGRLPPRSPCS